MPLEPEPRIVGADVVNRSPPGAITRRRCSACSSRALRARSAPPFCSNSIEMLSGERTNAMRPSRGGRLIVTPCSIEPAARGVDVLDLVGEVAERAADAVLLGVPVVGQFDLRRVVAGRGQEHQREAALRIVVTAHFAQAERVAVEAQRLVEVGHADHRVQVFHRDIRSGRLGSMVTGPGAARGVGRTGCLCGRSAPGRLCAAFLPEYYP